MLVNHRAQYEHQNVADLDEDQALQRWVGAGELADLRDLVDGPSNEDSGGEHEEARKRPAFLAFVSWCKGSSLGSSADRTNCRPTCEFQRSFALFFRKCHWRSVQLRTGCPRM